MRPHVGVGRLVSARGWKIGGRTIFFVAAKTAAARLDIALTRQRIVGNRQFHRVQPLDFIAQARRCRWSARETSHCAETLPCRRREWRRARIPEYPNPRAKD